jgi:hypothetical protein
MNYELITIVILIAWLIIDESRLHALRSRIKVKNTRIKVLHDALAYPKKHEVELTQKDIHENVKRIKPIEAWKLKDNKGYVTIQCFTKIHVSHWDILKDKRHE